MNTSLKDGLLTFHTTLSSKELTLDAIRDGLAQSAGHLTGLSFPHVRLTETAVRFLLDQADLTTVDRLYLNGSSATPADLSLLLSSPKWTGLQRLEMQGYALTHETTLAFAKNPALANLRELAFVIREDGEAILEALSGPESVLRSLETLSLIGRGLNAAGVRHLLVSPNLLSLCWLRVMLPPLDWQDLDVALTIPLRQLDIIANTGFALGGEGCVALANLPWLRSLTALRVMPNHHIGQEGAKALMASPYLTA